MGQSSSYLLLRRINQVDIVEVPTDPLLQKLFERQYICDRNAQLDSFVLVDRLKLLTKVVV